MTTPTKYVLHLASIASRRQAERIVDQRLRLWETGETQPPVEISADTLQALEASLNQPPPAPDAPPASPEVPYA